MVAADAAVVNALVAEDMVGQINEDGQTADMVVVEAEEAVEADLAGTVAADVAAAVVVDLAAVETVAEAVLAVETVVAAAVEAAAAATEVVAVTHPDMDLPPLLAAATLPTALRQTATRVAAVTAPAVADIRYEF